MVINGIKVKVTLIGRGASRTTDTVMVYVDGKYVGTTSKDAVKAYLKVILK